MYLTHFVTAMAIHRTVRVAPVRLLRRQNERLGRFSGKKYYKNIILDTPLKYEYAVGIRYHG